MGGKVALWGGSAAAAPALKGAAKTGWPALVLLLSCGSWVSDCQMSLLKVNTICREWQGAFSNISCQASESRLRHR